MLVLGLRIVGFWNSVNDVRDGGRPHSDRRKPYRNPCKVILQQPLRLMCPLPLRQHMNLRLLHPVLGLPRASTKGKMGNRFLWCQAGALGDQGPRCDVILLRAVRVGETETEMVMTGGIGQPIGRGKMQRTLLAGEMAAEAGEMLGMPGTGETTEAGLLVVHECLALEGKPVVLIGHALPLRPDRREQIREVLSLVLPQLWTRLHPLP